ncbi:MAG TPA: ParA family protein [Phenylobacterium sp.]|nr:ParA family protein [Phenylobacterium sp.]
MKTITVNSRKGGAGKTTVSVSLAMAARQAGLKVVLADMDPLRSSSEILRSRSEASSMLIETNSGKLWVLQQGCIRNGCDLLIIDTPTHPESEIVQCMLHSDLVLAVTRPTFLDLAAVRDTIALVQRTGTPGLVVLNQCPPKRNGEENPIVTEAVQRLRFGKLPVAKSVLRSRIAYQHAFANNLGVTEWDLASEAAADVLWLLAEISKHLALPRAEKDPDVPLPRAVRRRPRGASPVRAMQLALKRLVS